MTITNSLRRVEVFRQNEWQLIEFKNVKKGMRIRMFEPTGEPVVMTQTGKHDAITISDAYKGKNGILTFNVGS